MFVTRSGQFAYTTDKASIAQQKGSQLEADALKLKTINVARLKYPPALKPNKPVKLACIQAETGFNIDRAKKNRLVRVQDTRVVCQCRTTFL